VINRGDGGERCHNDLIASHNPGDKFFTEKTLPFTGKSVPACLAALALERILALL